jgi:SAM-dependent methyltransferase
VDLSKVGTEWNRYFMNIWESALGFYRIWIIHLGRRYRLFSSFEHRSKPISGDELAESLGLAKEPVSIWCDTAHSLGLLRKKGKKYFMPRELAPLLHHEDDVRFIGGLVSYLALRSLNYDLFDDLFRDGEVPKSQKYLSDAFKEGTLWDHTAFVNLILLKEVELHRRLQSGARVIDIGSGSGNWSLKLAKQFPNSSFLGIDPDVDAIKRARRCAAELGLNNVRFDVTTAESIKFSKEFDVAYIGEVLYIIKDRLGILKGCYRALRHNGILVVCEGIMNEGVENGGDKLVHAMQLDFALQGGKFFTKSQLREMLRVPGFVRLRFHHAGGGLWFAVAQKD